MLLAPFPRIHLAHLPTPLEFLPRLSAELGGPRIYLKRDDCTGLAGGGNKTRKLEFLMADARQQEADTIITAGAVQSNHARQTAAAAARLGMGCDILLENRIIDPDPVYLNSGNVLLDLLHGATLHHFPKATDMDAAMAQHAEELRAAGKKPYVIPGGGSNPIGALGYVDCAMELLHQANQQELRIDRIIHATGSAGTQAGLVAGLRASHSDIPVLGIGVGAPQQAQEDKVYKLAAATAAHIGAQGCVSREDIVANCNYIGEAYGIPTDAMREAVLMMARLEGILIDPVYTGKGMAGLIDLVRHGEFGEDENLVFIHTGGSAGLFGYLDQLL